MTDVVQLRRRPLKVLGVSRIGDNDKVILVSFSGRLTDEQLRFFHEVCERSVPLFPDENTHD